MKTTLLKKIKKRFSWYYKNNGAPVLMDHMFGTVEIFDKELPPDSKVSAEVYNTRLFRSELIKPFLKSTYMYYQCMLVFKKLKKQNKVRC